MISRSRFDAPAGFACFSSVRLGWCRVSPRRATDFCPAAKVSKSAAPINAFSCDARFGRGRRKLAPFGRSNSATPLSAQICASRGVDRGPCFVRSFASLAGRSSRPALQGCGSRLFGAASEAKLRIVGRPLCAPRGTELLADQGCALFERTKRASLRRPRQKRVPQDQAHSGAAFFGYFFVAGQKVDRPSGRDPTPNQASGGNKSQPCQGNSNKHFHGAPP